MTEVVVTLQPTMWDGQRWRPIPPPDNARLKALCKLGHFIPDLPVVARRELGRRGVYPRRLYG